MANDVPGVIDVTLVDDVNDLYIISDLMITDYSSTMFDYGDLKRPMVFYMYPFLHSLIGAGIVKLTSLPATLVLLGLNFLYITATAVLISRITYCYTKEPYTVILAFLLSHYCGWRYTYVSAFPDMLAVMLMILIIYLCTVRKERINNKYLPVLSILTVLCFYSKQYAIVIGLPVAIWLWLYKGKNRACII